MRCIYILCANNRYDRLILNFRDNNSTNLARIRTREIILREIQWVLSKTRLKEKLRSIFLDSDILKFVRTPMLRYVR